MKALPILLVLLISALLGCSDSPKTILDERAGYFDPSMPGLEMSKAGGIRYAPKRNPEKVVVAWLHAHELPTKDYFWGSWLSIVVQPESWEMVKVETPEVDPLLDNEKPKSLPKKRKHKKGVDEHGK